MGKIERKKRVMFVDQNVKDALQKLKTGTFEQKNLFDSLEEARNTLKKNPFVGVKVQKILWPKIYDKLPPLKSGGFPLKQNS